MIKSYIAVRVFVMLDIVGITLYTIALINGWPIIHTLTYPSAIVWCALSLPLAGLFVWSVYHRLRLVQNKHTHEQYILQQRDLMQLEQERQNLLSPYPNMTIAEENNVNVPILSKQSTASGTYSGHVQTSRGVQPGQDKKVDSDNVIVARALIDFPGISIRKLHQKTGIPISSIGATQAWQNRNR